DGDWAAAGDHAIVDELLVDGPNPVNLTIPPGTTAGHTYARFRYSPQGGTNWYGPMFNGEVEDYLVYIMEGEMDYGDAPDGYPVTLAEGGARHPVSTTYYLGEIITDSEEDGVHSPSANADNISMLNDETGAAFSILNLGAPASVSVMAHGEGFLNVWIDFNANGSWSDPGEQVIFGEMMAPLLNTRPFNVPPDATVGTTYARVRYSPDQRLSATGIGGPGEVEDYEVEITEFYDYGDAPAPFPTLAADAGAAHPISQNIYLGMHMPDGEADGQPDGAALGDDDADGNDDEDGVNISMLLPSSGDVIIPIIVHGRGYLHAWIDFDHSNTWDPDEKFINGIELDSGPYPHNLTMPPDVVPGHTYARFRYSLDQRIGPIGVGLAGEVEDYLINIADPEDFDYGDAPESYGNPSHIIHERHYLGAIMPDAESTGQFSVDADGDDITNGDEDGPILPVAFFPGGAIEVHCQVFGTGLLYAFFDWNQNGSFGDLGEGPFAHYVPTLDAQTIPLAVTVPIDAVEGLTYARFRFEYPDGPVDWGPAAQSPRPDDAGGYGEVEDFRISVVIERNEDYGDAPAGYEVGGDAFHTISEDIYMNSIPDPEIVPLSSGNAQGDDIHVTDDENAYISRIYPSAPYIMESTIHLDGVTGFLHAWIDFNGDGDWVDTGEKVVEGLPYPSGATSFSITRTAPADAQLGYTFARIRFSINQDLGPNDPGGDGEIEDYRVRIGLDFGDVPGTYLPPGGTPASHALDWVNQDMFLGHFWDSEFGPIPNMNADGDDLSNDDDEDGVIFGFLQAGFPAPVAVHISRYAHTNPTMFLNAWIDFNQNNDWSDLGEHVITDQELGEGDHILGINVPPGSPAGETYARFRLSLEPGVGPFGFGGVGEVEDYKVTVADFEADFGDAPDPDYPTYLTHGGAWHMIVDGFYMGAGVDAESDGQPNPQADGDTQDDGVVFDGDFTINEWYHYTITTSNVGYINAWADYNGDGNWTGLGEQILFDEPVNAGPNPKASFLPNWTSTDKIFYRFRYTREAFDVLNRFLGGAREGEVEDYLVDLSGPGAPLGLKWTQPPLYSAKSFYDST
ncbi:GEVED domain-containing protein, partial [bacterium]